MNQRQALGQYGERLAARWLGEHGMEVLDRNWRCATGEIDIIARDGDPERTLVVCEVKTRRAGGPQEPLAGLGARQAARLRRLAERWWTECWLPARGSPRCGVRLDLVGVLLPRRGGPVVQHVRGVS